MKDTINYLVIDHSIESFLGNRILQKEFADGQPGSTIFPVLADLAGKNDWRVLTADLFLQEVDRFDHAVSISYEFTPQLDLLITKGVKPGLLFSEESPNVARSFYKDLYLKSGIFEHVVLFEGALNAVSNQCYKHALCWPCPDYTISHKIPFHDRKFLCMVASYKYSFFWKSWFFPRKVWGELKWRMMQIVKPVLRLKDLYNFRLRIIHKYSNEKNFFLFGRYWEQLIAPAKSFLKMRFINMPYPCDDKLQILAGFKFTFVVENCIYPGYVTEKIYDAFRAGCIPVYYGAPDIEKFVPSNCFIDYRLNKSPMKIWRKLESMTSDEWELYFKNIQIFINSPDFICHHDERVAAQWLEWLEIKPKKQFTT